MKVGNRLRRLIAAEADEDALVAAAFDGAGTLGHRARALVLEGVTSVEEAVRVARQETASDPAEAA
jgi:general secretion pathway protein E